MVKKQKKRLHKETNITTLFLFHIRDMIKRGGDDKVVRFITKIIGRSNAPVSNF